MTDKEFLEGMRSKAIVDETTAQLDLATKYPSEIKRKEMLGRQAGLYMLNSMLIKALNDIEAKHSLPSIEITVLLTALESELARKQSGAAEYKKAYRKVMKDAAEKLKYHNGAMEAQDA
jgi:hypothetical protein